MLEGREFIIRTDHKPLTVALDKRADKAFPRQLRQLDFISQFTAQIIHITGKENAVADVLSRLCSTITPVAITTEKLAREQATDDELQELTRSTMALQLKKLRIDESDTTLYCDVSGDDVHPTSTQSSKESFRYGAPPITSQWTRH